MKSGRVLGLQGTERGRRRARPYEPRLIQNGTYGNAATAAEIPPPIAIVSRPRRLNPSPKIVPNISIVPRL